MRQVWVGVGRVGQGARSPCLSLATGFVHTRALRIGSDEGDGHCHSYKMYYCTKPRLLLIMKGTKSANPRRRALAIRMRGTIIRIMHMRNAN